VVSNRYEHGSIILTTNRGIANWGEIFDGTTVGAAILDRLLHHAPCSRSTGPATACAATTNASNNSARPPNRRGDQAMSRATARQAGAPGADQRYAA